MKIKICGMRDPDNVREVASLRPDFMGFIHHPRSPRHLGSADMEIVKKLPPEIIPVLVTVDKSAEEILSFTDMYGFRGVQLHGNEPASLCRKLRDCGLTVIKAISVKDMSSISEAADYEHAVDYILLDTACDSRGGSGKKFDWKVLDLYDRETPFILSGGIGPDDYEEILSLTHPQFAGIDLNSRFETAPALKDVELLKKFVTEIRKSK